MFEDRLQPHVVVVRGGAGKHRQRSLASGANVYHALRNRFDVLDVHLQTNGRFELGGQTVDIADVVSGGIVFHTLSGRDAARLQQACREHNIAHTGNGHTAFGQASELERKDRLRKTGVRTIPYWRLEHNYDPADDSLYGAILKDLRYPVVISPLPDAFSVDALVVENEDELMEVLEACFSLQSPVTVSDTYQGNVYAIVVLESFRGEIPYTFPAHELLHDHAVANAYTGTEQGYNRLEGKDTTDVERLAKAAFRELHLRDVAEVLILETPADELYILDVDPHPNLDRHSLISEAAGSVGATQEEVFSGIVKRAKSRHKHAAIGW